MDYYRSTLSLPDPDDFEKDFERNFEDKKRCEKTELLKKDDLLEKDDFIEKEFGQTQPPSRLSRVKAFIRKRWFLFVFIVLFLAVAILYIATSLTRSPAPKITTSEPQAKLSDPSPPVEPDTEAVTIQQSPPESSTDIPIVATFYSGVEGPKACRGHVIAAITLPPPPGPGIETAAQCYNFPNLATAGCANFAANKNDGCEARVYAQPNCVLYMNTHVFQPEDQARGGNWKSVMVQCGIPEPDPATLGKPPMSEYITSLKDNDKKPGGRRDVVKD